MDCSQTDWLTNKEYSLRFSLKAREHRVPISGSIDLTYRCNFRCVHCYNGHADGGKKNPSNELTTDQWKSIIDEICDHGCLYLLITGGDPFLHPDFSEIYMYAIKKGFIITIFTNGFNLTDTILHTLEKYPPRLVEITLYGASEQTYEKITGQKNGFNRCMETIIRLQALGIQTSLKTVLMTLNIEEFHQMEEIAASFGVKFRYDPSIFPRFNGDRTPVSLRVEPKEVIRLDFRDKEQAEKWKEYFHKFKNNEKQEKIYNCGSGLTAFHITADGHLQPCLMVKDVFSDLKQHSFSHGWSQAIPAVHEKVPSADNVCWNCDRAPLCNYCPPFSALEKGNENDYSEYLCTISKLRLQKMTQA